MVSVNNLKQNAVKDFAHNKSVSNYNTEKNRDEFGKTNRYEKHDNHRDDYRSNRIENNEKYNNSRNERSDCRERRYQGRDDRREAGSSYPAKYENKYYTSHKRDRYDEEYNKESRIKNHNHSSNQERQKTKDSDIELSLNQANTNPNTKKEDTRNKKIISYSKPKTEKLKSILDSDSSEEDSKNKTKKSKPSRFGKYGILNFSNLFSKLPEFRLWLKDTKQIENPETEEAYYSEFIGLHNEAMLPSKKYYDLTKYEAKSQKKKMKKNKVKIKEKFMGTDEDGFLFNDDERRKEYEKKIMKENQIRNKLDEICNNIDEKTLEEMREHAIQNKLMIQYYRTGHESSARDIHSKYYSQTNAKKKNPISEKTNEDDNSEY